MPKARDIQPLITTKAIERIIRTALKHTDIKFDNSMPRTGFTADTNTYLDKVGDPYLVCFAEEWDKLNWYGRGGFYYDATWKHPETGESIPAFLHRVLGDGSTSAGWLNLFGDEQQERVGVYAYIRWSGDWMYLEASCITDY